MEWSRDGAGAGRADDWAAGPLRKRETENHVVFNQEMRNFFLNLLDQGTRD